MIYDQLLDIFKRVMPQMDVAKVSMESKLATDLGVDSLNLMLLAITVEDEFKMRFDADAKFDTVSDIVKYVEEHKTV